MEEKSAVLDSEDCSNHKSAEYNNVEGKPAGSVNTPKVQENLTEKVGDDVTARQKEFISNNESVVNTADGSSTVKAANVVLSNSGESTSDNSMKSQKNLSAEGAEGAAETRTPSRASLRQRHRKETVPEKVEEEVSPPKPVIKEKLPPVDRPINWFEGDLVWSLVAGHPLWPCMISCDPEAKVHTKLRGCGMASNRTYHVQFFGNSPEHAWINEPRVFKFNSSDEYEGLVKSLAKRIPKRPPKVEISSRFADNWNAAIKEIAGAVPLTKEERKEKYELVYINNYPYKPAVAAEIQKEKEAAARDATEKMNKRKDVVKTPIRNTPTDSQVASDISETLDFVIQKYAKSPGLHTRTGDDSSKEISQITKKSYACMYCDDIYFSVVEMRKHCKEKHPEKTKLLNSSLSAGNTTGSKSPKIIEGSEMICQICNEKFANKRSLGQHKRFSHPNVLVPGNPVEKSKVVNSVDDKPSLLPKNMVVIPVQLNKTKPELPSVVPRLKSRPLLSSQGKKDPVCVICEKNGDVITCTADCCRSFHAKCVENQSVSDPFVCKECKNNSHSCIICGKPGDNIDGLGELKRCVVAQCGRYFHSTCLQIYKLKGAADNCEKVSGGAPSTRCPSHSCATCLSKSVVESSRGGDSHYVKPANRTRLFKCVRCPVAYHVGDECLAAGSVLLGGLNIVCPSHFKPVKTLNHHHPVHISWCFVCSKGGELICCAACPAAFHAQCIDLEKPPEGDWHCLDCSCGIRPLYDDIVWVKLGTYRWWPGQVTHPNDIPDNIARLQHGPGEFVVRFFGSNDYFWLSKCRVFLYQDGDNGATNRHCSRGISGVFKKALQEAEDMFRAVSAARELQEDMKLAVNGKKPAPYKHVRCNKPVGNVQIYTAALSEMAKCSCRRTDLHPCGAESECLNRMLLYECHPAVCPAGDKCENQRFQKCDYPATEVFKTTWGGWGLKTKVAIKKGTFVNEYVGELVDEEECRRRIEHAHDKNITNFYMLTIDKDRIIDAGPKGNYSRFMNHCCDPNCETQKWSVNGDTRVGLFACRDILVGEELTFNYNLDCLGNDKTKCMCGSKNCSGFIGVRPKAQMNGIKRERKKKRKPRKLEHLPQHDDFCFRCRHTGTLVCCDFKGCLRAFCMVCLHIDKPPYGKWECPCHHCDWCGRRAQYFCSFCPNSFCGSHMKNQLQPSIPNKFDTCTDHDPHTAEFEMAQVVAMVNDLMNMPMDQTETVSATPTPPTESSSGTDSGHDELKANAIAVLGQKRKRKPAGNTRPKKAKKLLEQS